MPRFSRENAQKLLVFASGQEPCSVFLRSLTEQKEVVRIHGGKTKAALCGKSFISRVLSFSFRTPNLWLARISHRLGRSPRALARRGEKYGVNDQFNTDATCEGIDSPGPVVPSDGHTARHSTSLTQPVGNDE